jgi:hypothetical protein
MANHFINGNSVLPRVYGQAYLSANSGTHASAATIKCPINITDSSIGVSLTSNGFTPPAGTYRVTANAAVVSNTVNSLRYGNVAIYVGGSIYRWQPLTGHGTTAYHNQMGGSCSTIVTVNGSQAIEVYAQAGTTAGSWAFMGTDAPRMCQLIVERIADDGQILSGAGLPAATVGNLGGIKLNDDFIATTARPGLRPETRLAVVWGNTAQTGLTSNTWTKVLFNNEDVDIGNCFASSTFTPNVAGWYRITANMQVQSTTANVLREGAPAIYKNGTAVNYGSRSSHTSTGYHNTQIMIVSHIVYANGTTDYFEIWAFARTNTDTSTYQISPGADLRYASFELIHKA